MATMGKKVQNRSLPGNKNVPGINTDPHEGSGVDDLIDFPCIICDRNGAVICIYLPKALSDGCQVR